jgi:hypothetical protein
MKHFLLVMPLAVSLSAKGQQIIRLPDGDFIDTVQTRPADCPGAPLYRYYMVGGKYPRSSDTLTQGAQAFLQQQGQAYTGSGFVTFQFVVDGQGRRQRRTQVLQTDRQYHPYQFAPPLLTALYAYLQTLTTWKAVKTPTAKPICYRAYLTFKLQDGKVVAVAP